MNIRGDTRVGRGWLSTFNFDVRFYTRSRVFNKNNKGFTLIELMVVIAIIGILVAIAVPTYNNHINKTRQLICETNRQQLLRQFNVELVAANGVDTPNAFEEFLKGFMREHGNNICPSGGDIEYADKKFTCTRHSRLENSNDDEDGGSKPYL